MDPERPNLPALANSFAELHLTECEHVDDEVPREQIRIGKPLVDVDILYPIHKERLRLLSELSREYGMQFVDTYEYTPTLSLTSLKRIIQDREGRRYVLKQKPTYALVEPQCTLSARLQLFLSERLSTVTPIVRTKAGHPYAYVNDRVFLLTNFI